MSHFQRGTEATLDVWGGSDPYKLILEPWADEFTIAPEDKCTVVALDLRNGENPFMVELHKGWLVVTIEASQCRFVRNGLLEFESVKIPPPPTPHT